MRPLNAQLEDGYCSITVANHRLITVIRFVVKNYTHPWKDFANKIRLVLHACEIFFSEIVCATRATQTKLGHYTSTCMYWYRPAKELQPQQAAQLQPHTKKATKRTPNQKKKIKFDWSFTKNLNPNFPNWITWTSFIQKKSMNHQESMKGSSERTLPKLSSYPISITGPLGSY